MTTIRDQSDTRRGPGFLATEAVIAVRVLVVGIAAVALIWAAMQIGVVSVAAFLAFAQAAMLWPLAARLQRVMPAVLAAIIAVTLWVGVLSLIGWFVVSQIVSAWPSLGAAMSGGIDAIAEWVRGLGDALPSDVTDQLTDAVQGRISWFFGQIGSVAVSGLSILQVGGSVLFISLFATVFALTGGRSLLRQTVAAAPEANRRRFRAAIVEAFTTARWWMWASTVTGLVDGLFIGLGLKILGVPLAAAIGGMTFILGFIPMIGATIAGAVAVLVAFFFGGLSDAVWALIIVLAVQQIEGNVLSPLLMSRAMSFPPLVTFLLASAGGFALGLPGIFLAVPVCGVLVALRRGWQDPAGTPAAPEIEPDEIGVDDLEPEDSSDAVPPPRRAHGSLTDG